MKKGLICICLVLVMLLLSGCTGIVGTVDELLAPPRPTGELYFIQKALDDSVSGDYVLKYPLSGDYRSAFVRKDVDGDGTVEAFAFYSTTSENIVTMHVNLITKLKGEWTSVGDFPCVATGVDTVEFSDMDGDGNFEIVVGWSIYGTVDKSVGVYSLKNNVFAQRIYESYSRFMCQDIDGDKRNDLFLTHIDTVNQQATAKFIRINDKGAAEINTCPLDGLVTSHLQPVVSKLMGGEMAIYIDAVKGDGMITEVLGLKNGKLYNALENQSGGSTMSTYRASNVLIMDIDGDGVYEIPLLELITESGNPNDNIYKTYWYAYDGEYLILKNSTIMNYADGWYIELPPKWEDSITIIRDTAKRERIFMRIDDETGISAEVILKIRVVPISTPIEDINSYGFETFEITRNEEFYFAASVNLMTFPESVTKQEIIQMFKLIK
ncbi:MAG: hypothetical protein U0K54_02305 [Acutalibacteraceae bacterium]|nr:hypothetical protein [Acutalibacteraceae bacterium]